MHFSLDKPFVVVAISFALAAAAVHGASLQSRQDKPTINGPTDEQIKFLTQSHLNPPYGYFNNVGFPFHENDKAVLKPKSKGKLDFKVIIDCGRCAGSMNRYHGTVAPYDAQSLADTMKKGALYNNVSWIGDTYANRVLHLKRQWNGRVFCHDQPNDNPYRTDLASIRIVAGPDEVRAWYTADIDEETGVKQNQVHPITYLYFGDSPDEKKEPVNNNDNAFRGMKNSTMTTQDTKGNYLYFQAC